MVDLTVCVGENCHLNGAELVIRSFKDIISAEKLQDKVMIKGAFCLGACDEKALVSVRIGEQVLRTSIQDAKETFYASIKPMIETSAND